MTYTNTPIKIKHYCFGFPHLERLYAMHLMHDATIISSLFTFSLFMIVVLREMLNLSFKK